MYVRFHPTSLALLLIAVFNAIYLGKQLQTIVHRNRRLKLKHTYLGHDFPEDLPLQVNGSPLAIPVLVEESIHYPLLGNASDAEWFSLTSEGFGYVRLGENDRVFMVTMFHEMHCLRILNLAFSKEPIASPEHIQHCLNYLRQGALCSPDLSLEPGNFEEKDFSVERTGAVHMCYDWETVYDTMKMSMGRWMEKNHGTKTK